MARFIRRKMRSAARPGSLIFIGKQKVERTSIHVIDYDAEQIGEFDLTGIDQPATWRHPRAHRINIYGLHVDLSGPSVRASTSTPSPSKTSTTPDSARD